MSNSRKTIGVDDSIPLKLLIPLSFQHAFAMFGGSILIPIIFGINPNIALLMNGIGTLIFLAITKNKVPAFLGSSGAFIAPTLFILSTMEFDYALGAFFIVGILGMILSYIVYRFGISWIDIILPPAAMGAVVALIGFDLAKYTVSGGKIGANIMTDNPSSISLIIFTITLVSAVLGSVLFRKFFATMPILIAIIIGYITSIYLGVVDFSIVLNARLFSIPDFRIVKFNIYAIISMMPVLLVIISEHISHQAVTSRVIGKDLLKYPGLHKSLFADNFSTALSAIVGGVPTTTYGENIGVMAVTKVYSPKVIRGAAIISILMAFIGPFSALIQSIPGDVIGGVTFLLYGMIGTSGIRLLVEEKVDFNKSKNLILTSVVFISGLSGLEFKIMGMSFQGMNLASIIAMFISLLFYIFEKFNLLNEK